MYHRAIASIRSTFLRVSVRSHFVDNLEMSNCRWAFAIEFDSSDAESSSFFLVVGKECKLHRDERRMRRKCIVAVLLPHSILDRIRLIGKDKSIT